MKAEPHYHIVITLLYFSPNYCLLISLFDCLLTILTTHSCESISELMSESIEVPPIYSHHHINIVTEPEPGMNQLQWHNIALSLCTLAFEFQN